MPFFLILCLRSRDNLEPWPLMAFLLPPEEIVYYHYQLQHRYYIRMDKKQEVPMLLAPDADVSMVPPI